VARGNGERLRGEARDEQIRSGLEPLAPGERPGAVTVAALVATALGLANLIAYIAGVEIDGRQPEATAIATFCAVMAILAIGMWLCNYWVVLAFQALLTIVVIVFCLFALRASDVWGALICSAIVIAAGWLFWKLVRAMARMQMQQSQ
jgi:succinate-acetate transporter protein